MEDLNKVVRKFEEFMQFCQKLRSNDSYFIVNRNSPILADSAKKAAENNGLKVTIFNLTANKPYEHFPKKLSTLLRQETPKAGVSLFDYSYHPDWNLKEVGARIELLHQTIEQIPISWAHSPGITLDMALNGPLQCNYKRMAQESVKILENLQNIRRLHITAPRGTDVEIEVPKQIKFDTDCVIVPPDVYGQPGKVGNLPVGEVCLQKDDILKVVNVETGKDESQSYPVKLRASGKVVCDVTVGGCTKKVNPEKPITVHFEDGVLTDFFCEDRAFYCIQRSFMDSQAKYGLPTVLEEIGIGLNEKARITGNMLEDEKIRGTCHLAPGNVRCHVDMLINKPTITAFFEDGTTREILRKGELA